MKKFNHTFLVSLLSMSALTLIASCADATSPPAYVYDTSTECLIGGYYKSQWLKSSELAKLPAQAEKYTAALLGEKATTLISLGGPIKQAYPCNEEYTLQFALPPGTERIAVNSRANNVKRAKFKTLKNTTIYDKAIAEVLAGKGIPNAKIKLKQIIKVDLQSDGVDEVLIAASYLEDQTSNELLIDVPPYSKSNDYNIVILRQVINEKVDTQIIVEDIHLNVTSDEFNPPPSPRQFKITGILDVNGDGVMEIVINALVLEGNSVQLHEYTNGKFHERLFCGCGL